MSIISWTIYLLTVIYTFIMFACLLLIICVYNAKRNCLYMLYSPIDNIVPLEIQFPAFCTAKLTVAKYSGRQYIQPI